MSEDSREIPPQVEISDERRDVQNLLEIDEETKDPELSYKWVNSDKLRVARHRMRGYRPVEKGQVELLAETDDAADGTIRVGDLILMAAPKQRVEKRKAEMEALATGRLAMPKKKVENEAKKYGVDLAPLARDENKETR